MDSAVGEATFDTAEIGVNDEGRLKPAPPPAALGGAPTLRKCGGTGRRTAVDDDAEDEVYDCRGVRPGETEGTGGEGKWMTSG